MHSTFGKIAMIAAIAAVLAGIGVIVWMDQRDQQQTAQTYQQNQANQRKEKKEFAEKADRQSTALQETVNAECPSIACWGDAYMAGTKGNSIPTELEKLINSTLFSRLNMEFNSVTVQTVGEVAIPVYPLGMKEETFDAIMVRTGAEAMYLAEPLKIPASTGTVAISFQTKKGAALTFLPQTESTFGKTTIDGIEGGIYFNSKTNAAKFARNEDGTAKTVKAGTQIHTEGQEAYRDSIAVLCFGENAAQKPADYVKRQKAVIDRQKAHKDKYIVMGRTAAGSDLDKQLQKTFGDRYIRLDKADQPDNAEEVAKTLYQKMDSLGYFTAVKEKVAEAEKELGVNA